VFPFLEINKKVFQLIIMEDFAAEKRQREETDGLLAEETIRTDAAETDLRTAWDQMGEGGSI